VVGSCEPGDESLGSISKTIKYILPMVNIGPLLAPC
jgi:hypothetical protein